MSQEISKTLLSRSRLKPDSALARDKACSVAAHPSRQVEPRPSQDGPAYDPESEYVAGTRPSSSVILLDKPRDPLAQ